MQKPDNSTHPLIHLVYKYMEKKGKVWPTPEDSILFLTTELAEAIELLLSQKNYVRNNPQNKEMYSSQRFAEELGDIILMAIVSGMVCGVDPVTALEHKLSKGMKQK